MLAWKRRSPASDSWVGCFPHCIPKRSRTPASSLLACQRCGLRQAAALGGRQDAGGQLPRRLTERATEPDPRPSRLLRPGQGGGATQHAGAPR